MKAFVTILIAFTALSTAFGEDSGRTEKHSVESEDDRHFPSHNNHDQQEQFEYHYTQPHQAHQHSQQNWFHPKERLNQPIEKYYSHSHQKQPEWESHKQHVPSYHGIDHQLQHVHHQDVQYHSAQNEDQYQHHQQQHHQAQYQPHYEHLVQEEHPHQHGRHQLMHTKVVPYPIQHQKQPVVPANYPHPVAYENTVAKAPEYKGPVYEGLKPFVPVNYPHPVAYENNVPKLAEYKAPVFEGLKHTPYQMDRPVQVPVHKPVHVIRLSKPTAVHVDKPYPMYMEYPAYREKSMPMATIIIKEKSESLWG